ncbi:MAG: hypothetical protein UEA60_09480 [Lachnospiraceae bacterium]|nr:hypothetical protein [Lachnospiraceae bacterium]
MKKKDILLDFTSLLDVTLILIFFFVIFSHFDNVQSTAQIEDKESKLESQINDAAERESQAQELKEQLEYEIGIVQDADDRAKDNVEEILEFTKGTNLKLILEMQDGKWTLVVSSKNEVISRIAAGDDVEARLADALESADYAYGDTILCDFVYNGSQAGTVSAYRKITKAMEAIQEEYKYLYYSETDLSVGEE